VPIERQDVLPLVEAALPGFAPDPMNEDGDLGHYSAAYDVAQWLADRAAEGDTTGIAPLLAVVERLLTEGDEFVDHLGVTGYLEKLQRRVRAGEVPLEPVMAALGPRSRELWFAIDRFVGKQD
jgi:hypothetical protein